LQVELGEQLQAVLRRFVRAAPEGFLDDDETERVLAHGAPFETGRVGEARGEDGASQLPLLPARLATRIGEMLVLAEHRAAHASEERFQRIAALVVQPSGEHSVFRFCCRD
jgi:hypothetical protein